MYLVLIYKILPGIWYFVNFNYFFCLLIIFYYVCIIFRYWFPFYRNNSYIGYIYIILSHIIDDFHEKYFYCNSFPINMNQHDTWTINSIYINTLEKSLIEFVENNEDKIKSAMTNPGNIY